MAIQKFGDVEKLEVLRGEEAQVLNDHMTRTGKYAVSDFTEDEKESLAHDLEAAKWVDEGGAE